MSSEIVVLQCEDCGDTFATHPEDDRACPSCGGDELRAASEPFL